MIATRLVLGCTNIAALPEGLRVGGGLYLQHTNITALPKGLNNVSGDLALSDTNITALRVGGFLDVEDTSTAALPEGLSVGGPPLFDRHKNYGAARGAQCWWDPLSDRQRSHGAAREPARRRDALFDQHATIPVKFSEVFRSGRLSSCGRATSRPLSTELNRVGEPSLLVQNPDKFLDPFKRILILSTRIHNAIPVAPQ